jgi:uncharacterized protein (TIGR02246 family)
MDIEADARAIKDLLENQYASTIAEGDIERWMTFFLDDVIFMPPNAATLKGRDATREFARPFFEQFNMETNITVDDVEVSGDLAFARWGYSGRYSPKDGGDAILENGKEIWIFKRQIDGSWKCSHIIFNTDNPR